MDKNVNEYYNLKIQGCLPFNVTPNHPFYVRRMNRHNKYGKRTFEQPKWVEVKDLSIIKNSSRAILEQDYIGFPIIQEEKIPYWKGVEYIHNIYGKKQIKRTRNNIDLASKDFWYFVGRYIGDGWQRYDRKQTILCCGKTEKDELENLIRNANLSYILSEEKTTYRATISNIEIYEYLKQFGKGAKYKHLTKDIFELPIELLKSFIDGYLSADGYYDNSNNTYHICSISRELILGIQQCIAKCYHQPTTITTKINKNKIENREVNTNIAYNLSFRKEKCNQQHFIYEDGYLWIPFRKKELIREQLQVFNISVENDESYTVYNLACHNCSTFSMAGQREDAWGKEKKFREGQKMQTLDDLLFVFIDTVKKLKPKVAILENVEGLTLGNAWKYVQQIYQKFNSIGYQVKHWLLKGENMGIPQTRHRVFFIATRLDFDLNKLNMHFNYAPINYGEIKEGKGKMVEKGSKTEILLNECRNNEPNLSYACQRLYGKPSWFQAMVLDDDKVMPTIRAKMTDIFRRKEKTRVTWEDVRNSQTFPQDYNFMPNSDNQVGYICGMSVPPIMIKRLVTRLIESGLFDYKLKGDFND